MTARIKWIILLLVLSLAANVFFGGMMLGKGFRHGPPPGREPGIEFTIKRFGKYLGEEERQKVREILGAQRGKLGERYRTIKKSEKNIKALIAAPSVDRNALLRALEAHAALIQKMHTPIQRVMMEVIAELDQETRAKVAEDMFKRRQRVGRRPGDRDRPYGPEGRPKHPRDDDRMRDNPPHHPEGPPEDGQDDTKPSGSEQTGL